LIDFDEEEVDNIYFWGTAYTQTKESDNFRNNLEKILKEYFWECEQFFSEPDIIIETSSKIIFAEIKLKSGNNFTNIIKDNYLKNEYYKDIEKAKRSKCYELVRNWSIGNSIAEKYKKEFILLNIGLKQKINLDDENTNEKSFEESLNNKNNFNILYWDDILSQIKNNVDDWLYNDIEKRINFIKEQLKNAPNFA
ncbi:MAG: hypothetical protein LBS03_02840, partial [Bacteroidales bacterium]|nr:hypothetical protein [Bacteroidales bacterium]